MVNDFDRTGSFLLKIYIPDHFKIQNTTIGINFQILILRLVCMFLHETILLLEIDLRMKLTLPPRTSIRNRLNLYTVNRRKLSFL